MGWGPRPQAHLRFSVAAGPFVGFLLTAKQVTKGNSDIHMDPAGQQTLPVGSQSFDKTTDIKDQLHTANFGVDGNIGLAYVMGNGAATLLLGYTHRLGHL